MLTIAIQRWHGDATFPNCRWPAVFPASKPPLSNCRSLPTLPFCRAYPRYHVASIAACLNFVPIYPEFPIPSIFSMNFDWIFWNYVTLYDWWGLIINFWSLHLLSRWNLRDACNIISNVRLNIQPSKSTRPVLYCSFVSTSEKLAKRKASEMIIDRTGIYERGL